MGGDAFTLIWKFFDYEKYCFLEIMKDFPEISCSFSHRLPSEPHLGARSR